MATIYAPRDEICHSRGNGLPCLHVGGSMQKILIVLGVFVTVAWAGSASAAIQRRFALNSKTNHYITDGFITGGTSSSNSTSFAILDVRRIFAARQKIERILVAMGDDKGHPLLGKISYFHVSINPHVPRIEIDLDQTVASNVNQEKLKKIFLSSHYVKSAKIDFDPTDLSMTIRLELKKPVQLEVFNLKSKNRASRIVLDMKPLKGARG